MCVEFEKEDRAYQYQDPSRSKKYTIFSTERLYKKIRQHVFRSQESWYFMVEKNSFNYLETLPVKIVHFDVEFPSISQSNFVENSESRKLLNTSTFQLTTHSVSVSFSVSVSVLHSLHSYNSFLYLLIYFCKWVY